MMEQILQFLVAPLATIVVTWLVSRRLSKAEARAKEIENEKHQLDNDLKEIDIYKKIINDLKLELDERSNQQKLLLEKIELVSKQNVEINEKLMKLQKEYESLNRNYNELQKQYKKLLINKNKDGKDQN